MGTGFFPQMTDNCTILTLTMQLSGNAHFSWLANPSHPSC